MLEDERQREMYLDLLNQAPFVYKYAQPLRYIGTNWAFELGGNYKNGERIGIQVENTNDFDVIVDIYYKAYEKEEQEILRNVPIRGRSKWTQDLETIDKTYPNSFTEHHQFFVHYHVNGYSEVSIYPIHLYVE